MIWPIITAVLYTEKWEKSNKAAMIGKKHGTWVIRKRQKQLQIIANNFCPVILSDNPL